MSQKLFNDSWSFYEFEPNTSFEEMNSSDKLYPVDIPHDWMIYHTSDLYKNSIGFYKKTFNLTPKAGHHYFVSFDGVYMDSKVYLNNKEIFEWKYGYSSFEVDLTPYLVDGENTLAVSCNYQSPNTRWYSGAGIYRNVFFIEKAQAYIPSAGVYFSTEKTDGGFLLHIDTEAVSNSPVDAVISHSVKDAAGNLVVKSDVTVSLSDAITKESRVLEITTPHLWDISDPYLYAVETSLIISEKVVDFEKNNLGFRTIAFDCNKGFFLNGRNVKINGVCQHHDLGALGAAMNKVALRRQFTKLMAMGVNSIRTSHNMPAREVLELADEMGLLIYTESFDMWELPKTQYDYGNFFPTWWEKDVTSWVRRDRNHPSIIIWGIGNEIYDTHSGNGLKWTILLRDKVRELDYFHNAYISIGSNYIEWENAQKCSDELELSGYNYGERLYDAHHEKYPHWCIFGSETSSTVQSRGIYHFPLETRLLTYEDGQCSCLGNCTTNWGAKNVDVVVSNHRDRDFVFGQYLWSGWDYIGEPTPYFSKNSFFGQIDTAGFEKDTFYHYVAEWTDPHKDGYMVHLLPYWDYNEGQIIDICAYSNAPFVELFFNGVSQGRQFIDHLHGTELEGHWKLPYHKGELVCVAYDDDNNEVARDSVRSFDDPKALVAVADKPSIKANGEDLIFIEISTVDENGTFVANAKNRVEVSVSGAGRLVGLDNGDSTDYDEYKGSSRRLFSGKLLAIIASTEAVGDIEVTISSLGLDSAILKFQAIETDEYKASSIMHSYISAPNSEIPIRKISLTNHGTNHLDADHKEAEVSFEILPANATYDEVIVKALTQDAVEANFVNVTVSGKTAHITALGDGEFRLTAFANNDKDHAEIISELEFTITGLGTATHNPYKLVPGCQYSKSHTDACQLSFQGGVFIPANGQAFVTYDNVDFGDFGSDEVTLPIFSFNDELSLEIWEGQYEEGECLCKDTYRAKSWYNHYQPNTFKLSRRVKGTTSITFVFHAYERFSLEGFKFTHLDKAYSTVYATENSRITGDSFIVNSESIDSIGNNVTIEFDGMNFSEKGVSKISIKGRSNNKVTSLHILFIEGDRVERQLVEIPYSEEIKDFTVDLDDIHTSGKVSLLFLPGSNFDLSSFKFSPAK